MSAPQMLPLFSGIGGFELAGTLAGFDIAAMCEIDPFCQRVLAKNFPGVPIHGDIMQFDARPFRGRIACLTGGFPCQPFSVAGKGAGKDDSRYLWPEMLRIIGECQPLWILAENVPGLRARGADDVLCDLEAAGYTAGAFVVGSDDLGNSHRRKRVWIVGQFMGDPDSNGQSRRQPNGGSLIKMPQGGRGTTTARGCSEVAHANGAGRGERAGEQSGREELPSSEHGGAFVADLPFSRDGRLSDGQPNEGEPAGRTGVDTDRHIETLAAAPQRQDHLRERGELAEAAGSREGSNPAAGYGGYPFPFTPRPDDYGAWATVAEVEPSLMPCVEREVLPVADVVSARLVRGRRRTRNATLRALGNAIDPNVAFPFLCWIYAQLKQENTNESA